MTEQEILNHNGDQLELWRNQLTIDKCLPAVLIAFDHEKGVGGPVKVYSAFNTVDSERDTMRVLKNMVLVYEALNGHLAT